MIGLPAKISGLQVIRSRNWCWFMGRSVEERRKTSRRKTQDFKTQDFKTQDFKTQDFKTQDARRKTQEKRGRCFGCLRLGVSVFAYALLRPCQFGFADFPSSLALTVHSVGVLWLPAARWFGG
jgi:hypothetical protein